MLTRKYFRWLVPLATLALAAATLRSQAYDELLAKGRLFPEVGAGLRAVKRDAAGRYYVLTSPGQGVRIFNSAGQRAGQFGTSGDKGAGIVYGADLDVDSAGRVYIADRGANAVKIFNSDGTLLSSIAISSPTSVAAIEGGELAVASMKSSHLVSIFNLQGKLVREFGDPADIAERRELNRFANMGQLVSDAESHIYYGFSYLPEPTVRKYDRYGYSAFEIELKALEFQPAAQAARREILRLERSGTPALKPIVTACGVDAKTQEIWVALHGQLLHFDREGVRRGTYRTLTPEGARLEATVILVEPGRLVLGADPLGVFEFPRPEKSGRP